MTQSTEKQEANKMDSIFNLDNNTMLYKVEENANGELEYELNEKGEKIELCLLKDIEFKRKKIEDILINITSKTKIPKEDFLKDDCGIPIISQEQEFISGYCNINENEGCKYINKPFLVFGDHTCILKYINFSFVQGADGIKIFNVNNEICSKYVYFNLLLEINLKVNNGIYERHNKYIKNIIYFEPYSKVNQSITSLDLQKSIAFLLEEKLRIIEQKKETLGSMGLLLKEKMNGILDGVFSREDIEWEEKEKIFLEKSKNKELFKNPTKENINKLAIGRGEFVPKEEYIPNGEYPLYTSSKEQAGFYNKYNFGIENEYSITFPTDNIPTFNINYGYAWAGNVCAFIENYTLDIDTKYLYYYLHNEKKHHNNDYMNKFSLEYLQNNYKIFVPKGNKETSSLELQKSISLEIETEFNKIEQQLQTIETMKLLIDEAKQEILNTVFKG